mgnify:CR=1 FL=1
MKNKGLSLAILALLGLISTSEAHKLVQNNKIKTHDWDDLLGDQSVFNEKGYSGDTPEGYSDVVDEVIGEKEQKIEKKR